MTDLKTELRHEEELRLEVERRTRSLRQERDLLTAELKELRRLVGFYQKIDGVKLSPPRWTARTSSRRGHVATLMAQLTDLHWDEIVNPEEVMFLNAYNREIAESRFRSWFEKVVTLPRDYVKGVKIEGLVIPATGDIFSGNIHEELRETNETTLYQSVVHWVERMISALEALEKEYVNVYVPAVVGNHGRETRKPVYKKRAQTNIEWLFWHNVRARLKDRGSKVKVDVSDAMDFNVPIYGRNYLLTHGDQFMGGTGISGAFSPLMLGQHRKNRRQVAAGMPMETMVIGHLHQLINIPGVIMGGSMKGYDEFAFGLNLPPAEAGQAMWVTTPERAQTIWMPVFVQDRAAEGW